MFMQADKIIGIPFSPIRRIFDQVNFMRSQGKEVLSLGVGEPDFATPSHILDAMREAAIKGATHYTPNKGIPELRQAICDQLMAEKGIAYSSDEIICTVGVSEAVYIAMSAFLNPGDEVLIPDPGWLNYRHVARLNSAKVKYYHLQAENDFQVQAKELENIVGQNTKMIVLLDPNNPTGSILNQKALEEVSAFAKKHNIMVITDEIYEKIIYDGNKHLSIAEFPDMRGRTILLNGFSKAYAMTGLRLGYIAAPKELVGPMVKIHSYMVTNTNSVAQWGGIAALKGPQAPLEAMVKEFEARRNFIYKEINKAKGLRAPKPKGAFYLFVNVQGTGMDGEDFAKYLLEKANVAVIPGTAFGTSARSEVRISYASSHGVLETAARKIQEACEAL